MKIREAGLRLLNALGALIGYGFLAAFLYLICLQSYRWFRDGEWTHISLNNGLHVALVWYGVREDDNNRFAEFMKARGLIDIVPPVESYLVTVK